MDPWIRILRGTVYCILKYRFLIRPSVAAIDLENAVHLNQGKPTLRPQRARRDFGFCISGTAKRHLVICSIKYFEESTAAKRSPCLHLKLQRPSIRLLAALQRTVAVALLRAWSNSPVCAIGIIWRPAWFSIPRRSTCPELGQSTKQQAATNCLSVSERESPMICSAAFGVSMTGVPATLRNKTSLTGPPCNCYYGTIGNSTVASVTAKASGSRSAASMKQQ